MIKFAIRNISLFRNQKYNYVSTKVQQHIGYIQMNSEKDLNALSFNMKSELIKAVTQFQSDQKVKTMVLLSKVSKAFCAGANLKQFQNKKTSDFKDDVFQPIHNTFYRAKKPIIAAVNGVALGGGFQLALLCDIIICSEETRFGLPELKLGLIPGIGGTQRLSQIGGKYNAMRYVLTSEFINAKRAYEMGIVSEVTKKEDLHLKADLLSADITCKPLTAILAAKEAIKQSENLSMQNGVAYERNLFYPLFDTPAVGRAMTAFINKQKPDFSDL